MYNASSSEILEGTLVMADTVASGSGPQIPLGKGFIAWDHGDTTAYRLIGITVKDTPSHEAGYVLFYGYHNNILMDATGLLGMAKLRPSSTTTGAVGAYSPPDSANHNRPVIGLFARYRNTTSLRGQAFINFGR